MDVQEKIKISADFTDTPGARYKKDGPFSGEEFYITLLLPKFQAAIARKGILEIDLQDMWGFPSSFVSGSFGVLSRKFGADHVLRSIRFISTDNPLNEAKVIDEIKNPVAKP